MALGLHRITAGSGYDYLTRQVAAMDSSEKGHTALASYYTEKGEVPGHWMGSGLIGIDGLNPGDVVTAEQMLNLFGNGLHPLAQQRQEALREAGATDQEMLEATRLGQPFKVYSGDISSFRVEVARRLEALNKSRGDVQRAENSIEDRARIRSEVALERFVDQYGREPMDARELAGYVAKLSRQATTAVAGFDLTFSPVKSVSTLWALADPPTAAVIEKAHNAAVAEAIGFLESRALFTRTGTNGVRQVDVRGVVAAAFVHRDSRAGDPDLHTHVAIANKVQTQTDGRWLAIDGRVLFKARVAISETYTTALERHLTAALGVQFADRPNPDKRKLPVREIIGVDPALNQHWSQRRQHIEAHRRVLATQFQQAHGRPPTPVEAIALAQQATLATRQAKHEPRSLVEQRTAWWSQAVDVLGSPAAIHTMVHTSLHPATRKATVLDQDWFDKTVDNMIDRVEQTRSTWQDWHLRSDALRQVRSAGVPLQQVEAWTQQLVDAAIARSVPLDLAKDPIEEPEPLRRASGESVYTVAGAQLYTSARILAAEHRLVNAAGLRGGMAVPDTAVDIALLEAEANRTGLNAGQILLVREMATSDVRVQLAIAPAGSGKTTTMSALSRAWTHAGGSVIGLAPSASAAAGLGAQLDGHADTLAKLAWSIRQGDAPEWVGGIDARTLVIIDEAGMADTLSLDTVVAHVLARGGSVRLVGDDQQLAAVGAGGVLRDIQASHGALRLTELVRFADPAEGSASLALREGRPEALGFYLDNHRVHVGDETTMADDLFDAWTADRAHGLDSIMLAPTRELVAELNRRARTQRLNDATPTGEVDLADGNRASVGDVIITRKNDRRLRVAANDWVKNGDRWTVLHTDPRRGVRARHTRSGLSVTLPANYVADQVELGYASTTHTAQGITADTCHGLLTGNESRQQAYTMLTRGRHTNTAYLAVVGDGDPHTAIRPETINPLTPTDVLEAILARDESPVSAASQLREAASPAALLHSAAARYSDAVGFAAAHVAGEAGIRGLERRVDQVLPGLTRAEAWPALRGELLLVETDGRDPIDALSRACQQPLSTAYEPAAALARRIADERIQRSRGPLPWLPAVPSQLTRHPLWGGYLTGRADLVNQLSERVRNNATEHQTRLPDWATNSGVRPPAALLADVEVWRAAHGVPATDLRPTGERQPATAAARWQRHLDTRLQTSASAALDEWGATLGALSPSILDDDFAPVLARRLAQLSSSGVPVRRLLAQASSGEPLPDDHAAAALWWRLSRHLAPAVAERADDAHHLTTAWLDHFTTSVGADTARAMETSPWWPALVTTIEHGLQRGWQLDTLLADASRATTDGHLDPCQAWVWRLSLLTDTLQIADPAPDPADLPPDDLWDDYLPSSPVTDATGPDRLLEEAPHEPDDEPGYEELDSVDLDVDAALAIEALVRNNLPAPEPTDADIRHLMARADAWRDSPPQERLVLVNELAASFYERCFTSGTWARNYVAERFGVDLADSAFRPGYAPAGWTTLVNHLRRNGITDDEMLAAGVARRASTGNLIDQFRDRVVFPIADTKGTVLGFVGRRNPTYNDTDNHGPKYLNTAETPLFSKGDQLFLSSPLTATATPVIVEGPFDAIAVTLATNGRHVGVAPLGTSLTAAQAAQLREHPVAPIVATDPDLAGRVAAERDFWLLSADGMDPRHANLRDGLDPADLLQEGRAEDLTAAVTDAQPLADALISERLQNMPQVEGILAAIEVLAAQPPEHWTAGAQDIADRAGLPAAFVRSALVGTVRSWSYDPHRAAAQALSRVSDVKQRLTTAATCDAAATQSEQANSVEHTKQPPGRPRYLSSEPTRSSVGR